MLNEAAAMKDGVRRTSKYAAPLPRMLYVLECLRKHVLFSALFQHDNLCASWTEGMLMPLQARALASVMQ
jgi:hypothetical protein